MELTEANRQNVLLLIIVLSLICLCSSFLLFVGAVHVKATVDARISLLETYNSKTIPGLFLFVGLVNMLENGSCTFVSIRLRSVENREKMMKALLPVLIGGIVLVILELSSTIASLVHMGILDREFGQGIVKAMKSYVKGEELKQEIDFVQTTYKCCGERAYTDWFRHSWIEAGDLVTKHTKYLQNEGLYYSDDTPYSCCDKRSPRPCIHHHVHDNARHHKYDHKTETTLHHEGCRHVLSEMYSAILKDISIVSLLAAFLKIGIILLLRLIHTSLTMAQLREDWEATTPAWLYFFKEGGDGEYQKVEGEASETEDEGGGTEATTTDEGETDGVETTDEERAEGGETTDVEGAEGGETTDEEGGEGAETTDDEDGDGDETADDDEGVEGGETTEDGEDTEEEEEEDANANFSPPHNFWRSSKSGEINEEAMMHGPGTPIDQLAFQNNAPGSGNTRGGLVGNKKRLFETRVNPGRVVQVEKSNISKLVSGMKEILPRPRYDRTRRSGRDYSRYAYSRIGNRDESDSLSKSFQNDYNDNKKNWPGSGRSTCIDTNLGERNNRNFPHPNEDQKIDTPYTDGINPRLHFDDFDDSYNYTENNDIIYQENHFPQHPILQPFCYESSDNYGERWRLLSERKPENSPVVKRGTKVHGKIPPVNTIDSSFVNNVSYFTDHRTHDSAMNVSELGPLRHNMKSKSTENWGDKWKPLSVEPGSGADKEVVQFTGHPGDKLVDNSDVSNGPVPRQKSIDDRSGAGNYYSLGDNSTGYSFKHRDNAPRGLSRVRREINSEPDKQPFDADNRGFDLFDEETPTRLPPPVICETTLHGTPNQRITRPKPIFAGGHRPENALINDQTWPDISKAMFDPMRINASHPPNTAYFTKRPVTPTPQSGFSSEYDLIPTNQRRGHDSNMPAGGSDIPPEFSGDEVSPEVARINFPRALSMDCIIDIDSPPGCGFATPVTPLAPTVDKIATSQRNQDDSEDGSSTPTSVKTTSSSSNLDSTVTTNQCTPQRFPQMPSSIANPTTNDQRQKLQQAGAPGTISPDNKNNHETPGLDSNNHKQRNPIRSNRPKNIFHASPISSSSTDLSTSSIDSKLYPKTSTPIENRSCRLAKTSANDADHDKPKSSWNPIKHGPHQMAKKKYPGFGPNSNNVVNGGRSKAVETLIDISDPVYEGSIDKKGPNSSGQRELTLISPFN